METSQVVLGVLVRRKVREIGCALQPQEVRQVQQDEPEEPEQQVQVQAQAQEIHSYRSQC